MTHNDKQPFAEMMLGLGVAYGQQITEPLTDIYFKALSEFSIEDVRRAGVQLLQTSKFFPTVSEFYDYIIGDGQDQAQRAWAVLTEAVGDIGGYRSLSVPDPSLAYAIERTFGGWVECCDRLMLPYDPMYASLQRQFVGHYRHARRTPSSAPDYFCGRSEAANRINAATFSRGVPLMDENGEACISQKVGAIIAGTVQFLNLNFNVLTGALTVQSRRFLRGGERLLGEG